ncbi:MAG: hypothetical protein HYW01_01175 [Deltaproteobacteria bacterium]|nr:hypothetical protein [Deltaproteobacteria bacterium]
MSSIYDYQRISSVNKDDAAANGQFILVERMAYEKVGGHKAIKDELLEDVALAKKMKEMGFRLYFGYGRGIVCCRMYKSLRGIIEGWTKNLFILIDYDWMVLLKVVSNLAFFSLLSFILLLSSFVLLFISLNFLHGLFSIFALCTVILIFYNKSTEFRRLNYPKAAAFLYPLGALFCMILFLLSAYKTGRSKVSWKGREYEV